MLKQDTMVPDFTHADSRVQHAANRIGSTAALRLLAVMHQHRDLPAEMLLVEFERLLAVAAVVQVGLELHDILRKITRRRGRRRS